ncbi:hypothetical protein MVES1_000551 [Malassezia vespertilionis]|uniref:Uncharacterized protein n=1 Tax=Malassezia vespertilionis TaxID=2020962 RepID=A0A2N1JH76_9BASI|nr:uncharacterized protein MVES1_000551 [Malassezia vespertilionis]PKI85899.1 hypothetical protein MVES_000508 [Malassezia vespertilionis]WFD05223.1 hypothetical protein MVES1_000551 [Malassezia vespertilionis]
MVVDRAPLLGDADDPIYEYELEEGIEGLSSQPRRYLYAPISYEQATAPPRSRWHPLTWYAALKGHIHILDALRPSSNVKHAFRSTQNLLSLAWPRNRMHQTVIIVFVLWFLVSYASFTVDVITPGEPRDDTLFTDYEELLKQDIGDTHMDLPAEDGRVLEKASWHMTHCFQHAHRPLRMFDAIECKSHTSFALDAHQVQQIPFLYVDPGREPLSKQAQARIGGNAQQRPPSDSEPRLVAAPTNVYYVSHSVPPNATDAKIFVNITASYFRSALLLARRTFVGKIERANHANGVQILTPPIGVHAHPLQKPLQFDIVISVPQGAPVAGFEVDAPTSSIYAFTDRAFLKAESLTAFPKIPDGPFKILFDYLRGKKKKQQEAPTQREHLYHAFGQFRALTASGNIYVGDGLHASGQVDLHTREGAIGLKCNITASTINLAAEKGSIRLYSGTKIHGGHSVQFSAPNGSITLEPNVDVYSSKTEIETGSGSVDGAGTWHVNTTLSMKLATGDIDARIAVDKPSPFVPGAAVQTRVAAVNGSVHVHYAQHAPGVPLRSYVHAFSGSARVDLADAFAGSVHAEGENASVVLSDSQPDGRTVRDLRTEHAGHLQVATAKVVWDAAKQPVFQDGIAASFVKSNMSDATVHLSGASTM